MSIHMNFHNFLSNERIHLHYFFHVFVLHFNFMERIHSTPSPQKQQKTDTNKTWTFCILISKEMLCSHCLQFNLKGCPVMWFFTMFFYFWIPKESVHSHESWNFWYALISKAMVHSQEFSQLFFSHVSFEGNGLFIWIFIIFLFTC